ncbi:MAG TPA: enoyl-CoA hydratase/isomerase family protein [Acidimicrobiales bacterium]|nr:enoyl-CoA hydratase/isomerase family protein [Acidimicrobiales bacterium]
MPIRLAQAPPGLLVPAGGQVPAAGLVAELVGQPFLLEVASPEPADWAPLAGLGPEAARAVEGFLAGLPGVSLGVGPVPEAAARWFDLLAAGPEQAAALAGGAGRAPLAVVSAAWLLRRPAPDPWAGLVAESATYSMLQAGPEFRAWLASREPRLPDPPGPRVRTHREGGVVEIVLCRPERHNALDTDMRHQLACALDDAASASAVILRGEGPSFCSGGDLDEFGTAPDPPAAHVVRLAASLAWRLCRLGRRTVAGVHGACLGAGLELAGFCHRVVAAEGARLGLPEAGLGLVPGAGGTVSLPARAGRQRVLELLVGAEPVDAATASAWGLVDEVVPADQLVGRVRQLAGWPP